MPPPRGAHSRRTPHGALCSGRSRARPGRNCLDAVEAALGVQWGGLPLVEARAASGVVALHERQGESEAV
jgi:hypothetical protein